MQINSETNFSRKIHRKILNLLCRLIRCRLSFMSFSKQFTVLEKEIKDRKLTVDWWLVDLLNEFCLIGEEYDGFPLMYEAEFEADVRKTMTLLDRMRGAFSGCTFYGLSTNNSCEKEELSRILCIPLYGVVTSESRRVITPVNEHVQIVNHLPSKRYDIDSSDKQVADLADTLTLQFLNSISAVFFAHVVFHLTDLDSYERMTKDHLKEAAVDGIVSVRKLFPKRTEDVDVLECYVRLAMSLACNDDDDIQNLNRFCEECKNVYLPIVKAIYLSMRYINRKEMDIVNVLENIVKDNNAASLTGAILGGAMDYYVLETLHKYDMYDKKNYFKALSLADELFRGDKQR